MGLGGYDKKLEPDLGFIPGGLLCQFQITSESVDSDHLGPSSMAPPIHHTNAIADLLTPGSEEMSIPIAIDLHLGSVQILR
jgi:hypothetical protein